MESALGAVEAGVGGAEAVLLLGAVVAALKCMRTDREERKKRNFCVQSFVPIQFFQGCMKFDDTQGFLG